MQLVLDSKGLELGRQDRIFQIISKNGKRNISPAKLSSIAITAAVVLHSPAIHLAVEEGVPILFFDRIGRPKARLWSPHFVGLSTLRRQQARFCEDAAATAWVIDLFGLKTEGQLANLRYMEKQRTKLGGALRQTRQAMQKQLRAMDSYRDQLPEQCRNHLMGIEGNLARMYWQNVGQSLPRAYGFTKRSRRPAEDIFNAALNYLYGMLYSLVETGVLAVGLDPQMGILHVDAYKKPTLVFDLIEAFRPWIDRLLVEQCFGKKIESRFFTKNQHGLFLNKAGKAFFIPLFNDFMRTEHEHFSRLATRKNHIFYLAGQLATRIRTENG